MDFDKIARETEWLLEHPHFDQKPASITEFLGEGYLEIEKGIRPGLKKALRDIFGEEVNGKRIAHYEEAIFTGGIGSGKQFDPDQLVLTPTGFVEIQSLEIGDLVTGRDGKAHRVTSVTSWNDIQRYKMTLKDGTSIVSGAEHLWQVNCKKIKGIKQPNGSFKTKRVIDKEVLSTEELYNSSLKKNESYIYTLPLVDPVEFDLPVTQEVHPYLMGLMIANGGFSRVTPSISGHQDDLDWIEFAILSWTEGIRVVKDGEHRLNLSGKYGQSNSVQTCIRRVGLENVTAQDKFIPFDYKYGSPEQRLALLRGLMDGDGSSCGNNRSDYSTKSKQLADDVAWLVRSLGGYCTITDFERDDKEGKEYCVHVNMDQICPFWNPRKVERWKPRTNQKPSRAIVKIEKIERGPGVCISIDSDDKLYVAGEEFIVTHNTTFASLALPYMVHWVLCLKDPQGFFDLLPGSRIAFMQMSTSESQAKEVIFGDIKARIQHSPWFVNNYPMDDKFKNQIRFAKDVWILPGDSAETTFEGYNILAGILDEMDSHKQTKEKDYADDGFNTIQSRIASRFIDPDNNGHKGLILCIGQMKKGNGFADRKYNEMLKNPKAYTIRLSIWDSLGWNRFLREDGTRDSFWYDSHRKIIIPTLAAEVVKNDNLIEVPNAYKDQFLNKPEKALRDLAGIPPKTDDPFISLLDRIDECQARWIEANGDESPVGTSPGMPEFADWFRGHNDPRRRAVHLDLAVSAEGDAAAIAMGHISKLVEVNGEEKPHVVMDCLIRIKAKPGSEIMLADMRQIVYEMKESLGFNIRNVSLDGFQSSDSMQQFRKKKYRVDYLSVDKSMLPYEDLREAIYDRRLDFPPYMTYLSHGSTQLVNIAVQELQQLTHTGRKVDHPVNGSKDVADAMAGVVSTLMGDRSYRRGVRSKGLTDLSAPEDQELPATGTDGGGSNVLSFPGRGDRVQAPVPPVGGNLGISVPDRLRRR